jgi:hypothetical protein
MPQNQKTCTHPGCDALVNAKGLCNLHYQRRRYGRNMDAPVKGSPRTCSHPGCDHPYLSKGFCTTHYHRWHCGRNMDGPPAEKKTCIHPGCDLPHSARGYCSVHYGRKFVKHSDMDAPIRPHRRKNEPPRECAWPLCPEQWKGASSGYCPRHETRRLKRRPMEGPAYYRDKPGWINKQGYRKVRRGGKAVFEHRIIMEEMLGRPLLRKEEVHHKNSGCRGRDSAWRT